MSEHEHTDWPVCPHCGNVHSDAWEWNFGPGLEGGLTTECDACGKPFAVSRHCSITYSTKAKTEGGK